MVFKGQSPVTANPWDTLLDELQQEVDDTRRTLTDIDVKLQQSQAEMSRMAERNTLVTSKLQKVRGTADALLPLEVRQAYDESLEAQQRIFLMRGQIEKLNSDKKNLENLAHSLGRVTQLLADGVLPQTGPGKETFSMVEAIIQAQEAERQRLSRQMHDGPAQALSNFILQSEIALRLFDVDADRARDELAALKMAATAAFQQVRNFVFELRPMMLDDLGLIPTLKRYVEAFKEQSEIQVSLAVSGVERRLESYIEVIVFRSVQDLLGFSHRQGQASEIKVSIALGDNNVKVSIEDNGKGWGDDGALLSGGLSIKSIKDRVEMLGGFMDFESTPGRGGYVVFQIPVSASNQAVFTEL